MFMYLSPLFGGVLLNWTNYCHSLLEKCKKQEVPFHVTFELTPLCNFQCNMCYIRLDPSQVSKQGKLLSTETWIGLAEEAKKMGAISMEVTGGEAMLRPDFSTLYLKFIKMGFFVILRTNGYLIDKNLELLTKYKPFRVIITLYGASDKTYQKVCGVPDGFSVVSKNIIALRDAGINIRLSATITKDNQNDIELMQKWASENGFPLALCGMLLTPIGSTGRKVDDLRVQVPEETYKLTESMKVLPREVTNKSYYMNPFWMCKTFGAKCTFTWDGKMTMCNSNPSIWKDPFENGVAEAYHDLYRELKSIRRPKECEDCKYLDLCAACPSMMYSATGSMELVNGDVCKYAHRKYKTQLLMNANNKAENELFRECDEGEVLK